MQRCLKFIILILFFAGCQEKPDPVKPGRVAMHPPKISGTQGKQAGEHHETIQEQVKQESAPVPKKAGRRKARRVPVPVALPGIPSPRQTDTLPVSRIRALEKAGIDIDLSEPLNQQFLSSPERNGTFPSMIMLSRETFLGIGFDNDILDYTDRFYTNGIRIDIIGRAFASNPLSRLLLPYWSGGSNYYGISVIQNMYTPSTTKLGGILYGDRPYAAYLLLGSFKITNDPVHRFRQSSTIELGIIGPYSFGEWVQRSFHNAVPTNNEPLGWEYQVQNDLVAGYSVMLEKGIVNKRNIDFNLVSTGSLGTLHTNMTGGFLFRCGWMNPYFSNLGIARREKLRADGLRQTQFLFFVKGSAKLVGYDATLQGGMINQTSVYTIPAEHINRLVCQTSAGISISYRGTRLEVEQFLLSPEFVKADWHKWVHIGLFFAL
jgi:hypothetical protein